MSHTTLEEHIEQELAHGAEVEEFVDTEYVGAQCPSCRIVFTTDEAMLSHVCTRNDVREY